MPENVPVLGGNLMQDLQDYAKPPVTPAITGLKTALKDSVLTNPEEEITDYRDLIISRYFNTGKILTNDEWKNSPHFREGLLPKITGSISENEASVQAQRFDDKVQRQFTISHMDQTILNTTGVFAAETAGFLLSPINILAGEGSSLLVGKNIAKAMTLLNDAGITPRVVQSSAKIMSPFIGERVANAIAEQTVTSGLNAVQGAAVGIAAFAPDVFTKYRVERAFGDNPDGMAALLSLGIVGAFGAGIHSVFGVRRPITQDSFLKSRETAVNQLEGGKSVDVSLILKDGYYRQRLAEKEDIKVVDVPRETIEKVRDEARSKADSIVGDIKKQSALLKDIYKSEKANKVIETPKDLKEIEVNEIFDTATGYKDDIINVLRNNGVDEDSLDTVSKFLDSEFSSIVNKEVNLEKVPRLEIEKRKLEKMINERKILEEIADSHDAYLMMNDNEGSPILKSELISTSDRINSVAGDSSIDYQKQKNFDDYTQDIPKFETPEDFERNLSELNERVKGSLDSLPDEAKEEYQSIVENQAKFEKLKDLIKKAANCLKGSD